MYKHLYVKYPLFLSNFNETRIFSTDFRKILKYQTFFENPSSGSQLILRGRTDGRTDMMKVPVVFINYNKNVKFAFLNLQMHLIEAADMSSGKGRR